MKSIFIKSSKRNVVSTPYVQRAFGYTFPLSPYIIPHGGLLLIPFYRWENRLKRFLKKLAYSHTAAKPEFYTGSLWLSLGLLSIYCHLLGGSSWTLNLKTVLDAPGMTCDSSCSFTPWTPSASTFFFISTENSSLSTQTSFCWAVIFP